VPEDSSRLDWGERLHGWFLRCFVTIPGMVSKLLVYAVDIYGSATGGFPRWCFRSLQISGHEFLEEEAVGLGLGIALGLVHLGLDRDGGEDLMEVAGGDPAGSTVGLAVDASGGDLADLLVGVGEEHVGGHVGVVTAAQGADVGQGVGDEVRVLGQQLGLGGAGGGLGHGIVPSDYSWHPGLPVKVV
jgi:hypothetical protein